MGLFCNQNNGDLGGGQHQKISALLMKWFCPSLGFGSTVVSSLCKGYSFLQYRCNIAFQ